jgi:hypothetical protein
MEESDFSDEDLSKIGLRGVVIHKGPSDGGEYSFFPDNTDKSWRQRGVSLGDVAPARGIDPAFVEQLADNQVTVAQLKTTGPAETLFLNLDAFFGLGTEEAAEAKALTSLPPDDGDAILIREDEAYYLILENELRALSAKDAGEAKIVVRRGAVTAAIPNNGLPLGTNCVLINKTQLVPTK